MISARKVTDIPGLAQTSAFLLLEVVFLRATRFFFVKYAPAAPNAPAAITAPPKIRLVRFFITWLRKEDLVGR